MRQEAVALHLAHLNLFHSLCAAATPSREPDRLIFSLASFLTERYGVYQGENSAYPQQKVGLFLLEYEKFYYSQGLDS